jgi:hypothetical protein
VVHPYPDPDSRVDVEHLEARTKDLRALDHRFGGGSCLDDVVTLIHHIRNAIPAEIGQQRFDVAIADLHNLAGWACFDIGLTSRAEVYFSQAIALAGRGHSDQLVADVFYRLGRIRLHHARPAEALEYFDAGQLVAAQPGCELAAGILSVNQAWAHAALGAEHRATELVSRGMELFALAGVGPDWSSFFTRTDLRAMLGTVHTELAHRVDPRHTRIAIPALAAAADDYGDEMARSRTFSLILLAMCHLVDGDVERGVDIGFRALASAENLASARVRDRMRPLKADAELHDSHSGARELAARITAFTTAGGSLS